MHVLYFITLYIELGFENRGKGYHVIMYEYDVAVLLIVSAALLFANAYTV